MKTSRIIFSLLALLFFTMTLGAQTAVVKVYPKHGLVVKKVNGPKLIVHKGVNYHYAQGVWYKARGKQFVVVPAPVGIRVKALPKGHRVVKVNRKKYYVYKGIHYKKRGRTYVVVNV